MNNNKTLGNFGESAACNYIASLGYNIIKRNWHCEYGEIDIIAENDRYIVFFEVKTRTDVNYRSKYGRPSAAVNKTKRLHMLNSAKKYLKDLYKSEDFEDSENNKILKSPRIDVIEILISSSGDDFVYVKINHIKAAVNDNN